MNWQLLIPLLATTTVAILGWYVVHAMNARRDRNNKRGDVRASVSPYSRPARGVLTIDTSGAYW
jgi:hypothetical protein